MSALQYKLSFISIFTQVYLHYGNQRTRGSKANGGDIEATGWQL
jgi:hypothetical protein